MAEALKQLSQGLLVSAAVAEFKGPDVFGVVRLIQVRKELAKIEASFRGLSPGKHGWSINEFGDLTKGPASTGNVFDPINQKDGKEALGHLQTLDVDVKGDTSFTGIKEKARVSDLIGRSIVVYQTEDKSDPGINAAVIARTAGVGDDCKKICACDGTPIWESTNKDSAGCKI